MRATATLLASSVLRNATRAVSEPACASFATSAPKKGKVMAVLYSAGEVGRQQPQMLGCTENALGLRDFLEEAGYEYVVTDDKEGPNSEMDKHLPDTDVLITTPFHPGYMTKERFAKADKLKMCLTAGIGSDHIDLNEAIAKGVTVAEITGSNVTSVAEHSVMMHLSLVRNYLFAHEQVQQGGWDVSQIVKRAWDIEGKTTGVLGSGRIGQRIMARLKPFNVGPILYHDLARMSPQQEEELNARFATLDELFANSHVLHVMCPLNAATKGLVNAKRIDRMQRGSYIINCARGAIADAEAVAEACRSGQLAGYAGDVWNKQPAPKDHPCMREATSKQSTQHHFPSQSLLSGLSSVLATGSTLDAQKRYAAGVRDLLQRWFEGAAFPPQDVIVAGGKLAPQYDPDAKERTVDFSREAEEFKERYMSGP